MKIGDLVKGFKVTSVTDVAEIKATAYQMQHEKTNAKLIWLKRDDDNKTFAIAFKTLPSDSTGVFHILEHSVLNGSEKYPLKEPFVDLLKGSLQTFLNAMTYPDKTVYPVASRNDKDFENLMRVYLDGVFHPMVKKNPSIFHQEGWHYELMSENDPVTIKGVVYNEMKGAFSTPEKMISEYLQGQLFPDNCYHYISGGDPEYIPSLSYEQFCAAHDTYYNPTNSYIWLDGDMDIEKILGIIDDEYLSHYSTSAANIDFTYQQPVKQPVLYKDYAIEPSADLEDRAFMSLGYVFGDYNDIEKGLALSIISSILTASNQSPLKKAILESGLAQDVEMGVNDGILQPYIEIDVYNTNADLYEKVSDTITKVLATVATEGLKKDEIIAYLNMLEFSSKERDFGSAPKGLVYGLQALNSWLYGGNPMDPIVYDEVFNSLKEKVETTYYDDLIKDCILNSNHSASIVLTPNPSLGEETIKTLEDKLATYKNSLTAAEISNLVDYNKNFANWQAQEDSPEVKATLPKLSLKDVSEKSTKIDYEVKNVKGINTLVFANNTEGINYHSLFFRIDDKDKEELQYTALAIKLLSELPSENYDVLTFSRLRKTYIGSTAVSIQITTDKNNVDYNTYIAVLYSCLDNNNQKALELVNELMYRIKFDDSETILEVLKQEKSSMEMSIAGRGNSFGISRVTASLNEAAAVNEYINGLEYYNFLKNTIDHFDESTIERIKTAYQSLFTVNRLTVSIMGPAKDTMIERIIDTITPSDEDIPFVRKPLLEKKREGIAVASQVAYAEIGSNINDTNNQLDGHTVVVNKILSLDYLWTNIRAMGGAYGCGATSKNGSLLFYSYRDPNPQNSLKVYQNTPNYLRNLVQSDFDLEQYIIGTIGDSDPLLTNSTMMIIGNMEYFSHLSYEERCARRKRILNTTREDILKVADAYEKAIENSSVCVVGGKRLLEQLDLQVIHEL